jgi:hypothetical protein
LASDERGDEEATLDAFIAEREAMSNANAKYDADTDTQAAVTVKIDE